MISNRRKGPPNRADADAVGLQGLLFLTEDEARITRFLAETGMAPAELGMAATQPDMLAAVLDHIAADESMLLVFASGAGIDPAVIEPCRQILSGEDRIE